MASIINASTNSTSGLVYNADASGILQLQSNGVTGLTVGANAAVTVNTTLNFNDGTAMSTANALGMRNRIINGTMSLDQRNSGASQTITAGAALAYTVDRWYAYSTGANVSGQQVPGSGFNLFAYRFTGAASVTAIGFGQRIESLNSGDMAGTMATLSVELANTLLTAVTWTAFYATTTDTFGTLASPAKTQIATGTFTVNSTLTRYVTQIAIPSAATTGIEIVFAVGAQTSGTWTIDNVQLESGTVATPIERRQVGEELLLCQRYYEVKTAYSVAKGAQYDGNGWIFVPQYVTKRIVPTITCTGSFANPSSRRTTTSAVMTSANALDGATAFFDAEMRD